MATSTDRHRVLFDRNVAATWLAGKLDMRVNTMQAIPGGVVNSLFPDKTILWANLTHTTAPPACRSNYCHFTIHFMRRECDAPGVVILEFNQQDEKAEFCSKDS